MKSKFPSITYISLVFFFILISIVTHAQFRKYSNEFLNIGAGAKGLGMGGAQVASVNDVTAGYWNPAGLASVNEAPQAIVMHAEYFSGIGKYDYAALALPIQNKKRTLGVSLLRFAVDDIPNTLFLVEPDGSLNYNNIQTFSSADYALLISLAQHFKTNKKYSLSGGMNAKVIYRKVGSFANALGFGFDVGLQATAKKWKLGLTVRDITTTFNAWTFNFTDAEKQALYLTNNSIPVKSTEITAPRAIIGGAYNFTLSKKVNLLTEFNADITFDGKRNTVLSTDFASVEPRLGLELGYKNVFFIRGGINNFQRALQNSDTTNQKKVWIYQPSIGAGFNFDNIFIDYAFTNLANQENPLYTHIISLKINFKKNKKTTSSN